MWKKHINRLVVTALAGVAIQSASGVNPYLPLWEHIPDGEPYLFDDPDNPGKKRVYIYGSHDNLKTAYCGLDQVVWSASPDSLDNWRYDGLIFESIVGPEGNILNQGGIADVLYAPDVAEVTGPDGKKVYYLFPNVQNGGRQNLIAKSDRPDGPFKVCNWKDGSSWETVGLFGFDPAAFQDDDGRVYGYWGFGRSMAAELDPATMCTVKPGTEIIEDMISGYEQDGIFRFFEASSIRKVKDKYVLVYSRYSEPGEWGLNQTNYTLAYAYSDSPLGPWTYGGTLIDGRGRDTDAAGNPIVTASPSGNTHGGILEINGQWWVFFHRQTGVREYSRQAMVAPIDVEVTADGKVVISEGEMTSEGFEINGLNPYKRYPAAIASHYTGPTPAYQEGYEVRYSGPYIDTLYIANPEEVKHRAYDLDINYNPMVNFTSGSTIGYKYFNFDGLEGRKDAKLVLDMIPEGPEGTVKVWISAPWKGEPKQIGEAKIAGGMAPEPTEVTIDLYALDGVKGKHPLYLTFESPTEGKSICTMRYFEFK